MLTIAGHASLTAVLGRPLHAPTIAIGNFDGVHRGHQALLAEARARAQRGGGECGVLTFDPHPARFFAPQSAPPMIMPLARRLELIAAAGMDVAIVEPFTAALAAMDAETFVTDFLVRRLGVAHVVVGYDFTFGRGRQGTGAVLRALCEPLGVGVTIVDAVQVDGVICSSTRVRADVLAGDVAVAARLLGRRFDITGTVGRGAARGRTIGFPTTNVRPEGELLPRPGIYAALARTLDGPPVVRRAALSVGTNPTFVEQGAVSVEAYWLDFEGDLYDRRVRLDVAARLRDEARFDSVDDLIARIRLDVEETRSALLDPVE